MAQSLELYGLYIINIVNQEAENFSKFIHKIDQLAIQYEVEIYNFVNFFEIFIDDAALFGDDAAINYVLAHNEAMQVLIKDEPYNLIVLLKALAAQKNINDKKELSSILLSKLFMSLLKSKICTFAVIINAVNSLQLSSVSSFKKLPDILSDNNVIQDLLQYQGYIKELIEKSPGNLIVLLQLLLLQLNMQTIKNDLTLRYPSLLQDLETEQQEPQRLGCK